jgi:hypothetical protein
VLSAEGQPCHVSSPCTDEPTVWKVRFDGDRTLGRPVRTQIGEMDSMRASRVEEEAERRLRLNVNCTGDQRIAKRWILRLSLWRTSA